MTALMSGVSRRAFETKTADPASPEDVKPLIAELGKAFEEFKSAHTQELAELKKRGSADVLTAEKVKRIDDALTALGEAKEAVEKRLPARIDALEAKIAKALTGIAGGGDGGEKAAKELKAFNAALLARAKERGQQPAELDAASYTGLKSAFVSYLRKGDRALDAEGFKALSVTGDPDGGYLVPADLSGRIVTRMFETSPMREFASVQVISSDTLKGTYDLVRGISGGWVTEKQARPETNTPTLGQWSIPTFEQYANPAATQQMLDDVVVDVEGWLARKTGEIFGATENTAFVAGDGAGKPRGFTTYATAATADATRPWGQFEHINSGANGAFVSGVTQSDVLLDLIGAFKPVYLNQNTRWFTTRTVLTAIRKFKDTQGQYLWQPGLQLGQPQTLLTFPVALFQDMPALATGSVSLALGDMSAAYQIVQRAGISTLRDPYTNKPYVHFYSIARVGGGALDFDALKFVRFSA